MKPVAVLIDELEAAARECRRGRDLVIQQGLRDHNEAARRRFYANGSFALPRRRDLGGTTTAARPHRVHVHGDRVRHQLG